MVVIPVDTGHVVPVGAAVVVGWTFPAGPAYPKLRGKEVFRIPIGAAVIATSVHMGHQGDPVSRDAVILVTSLAICPVQAGVHRQQMRQRLTLLEQTVAPDDSDRIIRCIDLQSASGPCHAALAGTVAPNGGGYGRAIQPHQACHLN